MKIDVKKAGTFLAAVVLLAPAAQAQQAGGKVAIMNVQGAILATKDGEKAREAMRVKFEPRAKEIEGRNAELQKKRQSMTAGANTMSVEAREKLSREIDDIQKKLQWDSEDMQNDIDQEQGKLVNSIGQRLLQVVDEYAKANGFSIVLDVSAQQSPVLWAANGIDITQPIVELYDKKFGAGGTAPGTPAPAPASAKPATPPTAAPKKPASPK